MNKRSLGLLLALLALASLTGCGNVEDELGHANDPSRAPALIGAIVITVFLLNFFLGCRNVRLALFRSIKWTSVVCLMGTPIYTLSTHSPTAGFAVGVTGCIGLVMAKTALKDWDR